MAAGAVAFAAGLAVVVVGLVLSRQSPALSTLAVASPGAGMVATAEGAGTGTPTHIDAAAGSLGGAGSTDAVPVRPDLYLEQQSVTGPSGNVISKEAAWWRVWWDPATATEDVVSLQAHLNASDASKAVAELDVRNRDPAGLNSGNPLNATLSSTFPVPGIPGSDGYTWTISPPAGIAHDFYFAVFARGSVTALVSVDGLEGSSTNSVSTLDSFAQAQYAAMSSHGSGSALMILGIVLALAGTLALALAARRSTATALTPGYAGMAGGWAGGPPSPYGTVGAAPYGTGGPPPYGTGGPPPYVPGSASPPYGVPSPYASAGPPGAATGPVPGGFGAGPVQIEPPAPPPLHAVIGGGARAGGTGTAPVAPVPPLVPPATTASPPAVAPVTAPTTPAPAAPATPAGWYPEQGSHSPMLRYWDGTAWTEHRAPATGR